MPQTPAAMPFRLIDLGRLAYTPALDAQHRTHEQVLAGEPMALLLVEHDPVITVTRRREAAAHVLLPEQKLKALGIDLQPTDRGGDVTYHGPGQLVAYPILDLARLHLNVGGYMRLLEQAVIDTLEELGVAAGREEGKTGVWVPGTPPSKVCAMGVRVRRNVTLHGLALNVTANLDHFATIVPCGLAGLGVTSLRQLLGDACPSMDQVKSTLTRHLARLVSARLSPPRHDNAMNHTTPTRE